MKSTTIRYLKPSIHLLVLLLAASLLSPAPTSAATSPLSRVSPPPYLLAPPLAARAAAPFLQTPDATLRIINDSDQTICYVLICPPDSESVDDCFVGDEAISPGESHVFDVAAGDYDVGLGDCNGNVLLAEQALTIAGLYELHFTGPDLCGPLNQEGMTLLHQAQYRDAIQKFQDALTCYREADDRKGEGAALNNIGAVYKSLGQYQEALDYFEQALSIRQEIGDRAGEGYSLNSIGGIYSSLGWYEEALNYYRQALNIRQEIGDRAGEGQSLNSIGTIYDNLGQYEEALDYYKQALSITQEIGDRAGEGVSLNNIGFVYHSLGHYDDALSYYRQALSIRQEVGDRVGEGVSLNNIGGIYSGLGQYKEALDYYKQALSIRQEIGDRAGEGQSLNNIGAIYDNLGQYEEARDYYVRALSIQQEIGDRAEEGTGLNNIGGIYASLGEYEEALDYYRQALSIRQEIGDRAGEGTTLNNIGFIYYRLGQYEDALDYYRQALSTLEEIGDRNVEGISLNNIGVIYERLGQYEEALDYYNRALSIQQEIGDRAREGVGLNNIGVIYYRLGQYEEALRYFSRALDIWQEISNRAGEGASLNNIGGIYDSLGQYQEALDYYQQALAIMQEIGDRAWEGSSLNNIGFIYERQNRPEQALLHYEQAMTVFESVRAAAGSEAGRASFIAQHADLYDRAINLYHAQGQDDQAFFTAERGRARAFLDSMSTGYVRLSDAASADLLAREQIAHAARQAAQVALSNARAQQPPDAALITDLESQLAAADEEHATALAEIEARHDQLAALVPGRGAVLDLPQVQALLDEQTTLVSFWVLQDQTLAFVVTREGLHTVALAVSQADLETQITDLRSFPNLDVAHPESAVTLYTALIAPLKEHLPSASSGQGTTPHLAIVPHSVLHYLPFAALTDGQRGLLDDYTLTYLPNASVLPFILQNADRAGGTSLILGNPTTADFDTTASLATERDQLGPLPFAEQEARAIAALYATTALTRAAATESIVRQQAGETGILHLAAHGYYNAVAPLNSLIALAPDTANDGWLTAGEVYGLNLQQADLVVLSACQTQLGDLGPEGEPVGVSLGDEVVGLARAFFYAGTPTVVASLWTVDDQTTALLMERFYIHLREGMDKAAALRQAQLDLRADYPNPYYWAAFVLSGDAGEPGPDPTETPTPLDEDDSGGGICPGAVLPLTLAAIVATLVTVRKPHR